MDAHILPWNILASRTFEREQVSRSRTQKSKAGRAALLRLTDHRCFMLDMYTNTNGSIHSGIAYVRLYSTTHSY